MVVSLVTQWLVVRRREHHLLSSLVPKPLQEIHGPVCLPWLMPPTARWLGLPGAEWPDYAMNDTLENEMSRRNEGGGGKQEEPNSGRVRPNRKPKAELLNRDRRCMLQVALCS